MGFFIYSYTFAIIEFDIHETIFVFWQSKYILQMYYFGGGHKFMHVSYNEWSLALKSDLTVQKSAPPLCSYTL